MVQLTDGPYKGKLVPGTMVNGKIVFDKTVTKTIYDTWSLARQDWYYAPNFNFNPEYNTMGAFGMPLPAQLPDVPVYSKLRGGLHKIAIVACDSATYCTIVDIWYSGERVAVDTKTGAILNTDPKPYDKAHTAITLDMLWNGTTWKVVWGSVTSEDLLKK